MTKPSKFAHVVYRTRRFGEMLEWYQRVFEASVQMQNPALAFLTYDDEHHRFAFVNLDVVDPQPVDTRENRDAEAPGKGWGAVGVDHVAYTYADAASLLETYARLRDAGVTPYWCVHHGVTLSMYFRDPDGNQMEFQVDCFRDAAESRAYLHGDAFKANPIGVKYDPEELLLRYRAGAPEAELMQSPSA